MLFLFRLLKKKFVKKAFGRFQSSNFANLKLAGIILLAAVLSLVLARRFVLPSLRPSIFNKPFACESVHANQSYDVLLESRAAVKDYVKMYRRQPPRGFDEWVQYATSRLCRKDREAYAMMEDELAPFRDLRPRSSMVRAAFKELDSVALISVRNGSVVERNVSGPIDYSEFYFKKISEFAEHVEDLDLIINSLDEPRVWWPEPLTAELEDQIKDSSITVHEALGQHGCQATDKLKTWHDLHAFLIYPETSTLHELAPVVSFSKIAGCFADLLLPSHFSASTEDLLHHGNCAPLAQSNLIPWDEKVS